MDTLILAVIACTCLVVAAWKSPNYKRRIGIALIASADADYYRRLNYRERIAQLTREHNIEKTVLDS